MSGSRAGNRGGNPKNKTRMNTAGGGGGGGGPQKSFQRTQSEPSKPQNEVFDYVEAKDWMGSMWDDWSYVLFITYPTSYLVMEVN